MIAIIYLLPPATDCFGHFYGPLSTHPTGKINTAQSSAYRVCGRHHTDASSRWDPHTDAAEVYSMLLVGLVAYPNETFEGQAYSVMDGKLAIAPSIYLPTASQIMLALSRNHRNTTIILSHLTLPVRE